MKTKIISFYLFLFLGASTFILHAQNANVFTSKNFKISFYSKTPVEDINAESKVVTCILIKNTKTLLFQVPIRTFKFPISMMEEHFNESYLESDKFPTAKFKGTLLDSVNYALDGNYPVRVQGVLSMHGVDKPRTIKGIIHINKGIVSLESAFNVACVDHKVEIPKIVFAKISEVIQVTVEGSFVSK